MCICTVFYIKVYQVIRRGIVFERGERKYDPKNLGMLKEKKRNNGKTSQIVKILIREGGYRTVPKTSISLLISFLSLHFLTSSQKSGGGGGKSIINVISNFINEMKFF